MKFWVEVERTAISTMQVEIEAENASEAEDIALARADDGNPSDWDSTRMDYTASVFPLSEVDSI